MCHVLIIEDECVVALHLEGLLSDHGATSFAFAETEDEAVAKARLHRPALIMSDVNLRSGTGPRAVETIQDEMGPLPVIFVTASPEACIPCDPPARVLGKPLHEASISQPSLSLLPL